MMNLNSSDRFVPFTSLSINYNIKSLFKHLVKGDATFKYKKLGFWFKTTKTFKSVSRIHYECPIYSTIPENIQLMRNLTYLKLSNGELTGTIPSTIGNLRKLQTLILYNNNLCGSIPIELTKLNNLKYLDLSNNSLTGYIPNEINRLRKLTHLILNDNPISGDLPDCLIDMRRLTYINVNETFLSGGIPLDLLQRQNLFIISNSMLNKPGRMQSITRLNQSEIVNQDQIPLDSYQMASQVHAHDLLVSYSINQCIISCLKCNQIHIDIEPNDLFLSISSNSFNKQPCFLNHSIPNQFATQSLINFKVLFDQFDNQYSSCICTICNQQLNLKLIHDHFKYHGDQFINQGVEMELYNSNDLEHSVTQQYLQDYLDDSDDNLVTLDAMKEEFSRMRHTSHLTLVNRNSLPDMTTNSQECLHQYFPEGFDIPNSQQELAIYREAVFDLATKLEVAQKTQLAASATKNTFVDQN
ncbi:hypothetical protein BC833DRAFT_591470 [Globomyces pollinis-pini]|nr:hypothetical protein BC833DRAFT_591470 [Globomyces pollinis-pini]